MVYMYVRDVYVFFFKQKTAYEMRISDWSSDVCSSDLPARLDPVGMQQPDRRPRAQRHPVPMVQFARRPDAAGQQGDAGEGPGNGDEQIGRASCRDRVCQYV